MFENMFHKYINIKNFTFFILFILLLGIAFKIKDIAIMFFASYVIACSLEPIVEKLSKKFKRSTASALTIIGSIAIICAFLVPIILVGGHEIKELAVSFPQFADTLKEYILGLPHVTKSTISQIDLSGIITSASGVTTKVIEETINIGRNLSSAFIYFIISTILIYYFIVDKDIVRATTLKLFPQEMRKRVNEIMDSIAQKIGRYVIAQVVTMASVGIMMTIGLFVLRIDYALILGLITAILDVIPIIGPAIALIICLIVCYKLGIGILALIILVFSIAQLIENNFIRPYIFGKFFNIHPILIYLFILISAKYIGLIGLVFAPAIAATVVVLIEETYMKNLE